jgi:nitrogen fixation protein FixH
VHTGFPGVIPHDRNKLYESHVQDIAQQKNLGWNVEVLGLDVLKNNLASNVVIKLKDKQNQPIIAATVTIELWRMANSADDQTIQFSETKPGEYHASLRLSDEGLWLSDIEIVKGEAHYALKQPISVGQ